MTNLLKL